MVALPQEGRAGSLDFFFAAPEGGVTPAGLLLLGLLLLEPATWGLSRGSLSSRVVGSTWVIPGVAGTG